MCYARVARCSKWDICTSFVSLARARSVVLIILIVLIYLGSKMPRGIFWHIVASLLLHTPRSLATTLAFLQLFKLSGAHSVPSFSMSLSAFLSADFLQKPILNWCWELTPASTDCGPDASISWSPLAIAHASVCTFAWSLCSAYLTTISRQAQSSGWT